MRSELAEGELIVAVQKLPTAAWPARRRAEPAADALAEDQHVGSMP